MKKIFSKENISKILVIFLIIQPVIDIHILFSSRIIDIFGFSPSTIFRIIGVLFLTFLTILFVKEVKKKYIWFIVYAVLVLAYIFFHHMNALNFYSLVDGNFGYNLITELFYIIRMILPLLIIFVSYYLPLKDDKFNNVIKWLVILISGSIIVTNLFKISLGSYTNEIITGNIFDWFSNKYNYLNLASKSYFNFANSIAALLVLITPLLFYNFIKKPNILNSILVFVQLFGMFMLGTKVATYGCISILLASLFIYYFFCFIKKELNFQLKVNNIFIIAFIISSVLLSYCPATNRSFTAKATNEKYVNYSKESNDTKLSEITNFILKKSKVVISTIDYKAVNNNSDKYIYIDKHTVIKVDDNINEAFLISFIRDNYVNFFINPTFILNSYPYESDPYFWYNIMNLKLEERVNYRILEKKMLERIKEINNNELDDLLGMTYTRTSNVFNYERDFLGHYYSLGIIGTFLLLGPYVVIPLICCLFMIIKYKKNLNLKNTMFVLGIFVTLFAAFYSGNVMDHLVVTFILAFVIGTLLHNIVKE